ncbi:phospholipid transfer protein-like isoform X2 [Thunnus thynnus]|uniref:phospholipid transfer protein-like isoform X2 n=1 Tax=Thunnus thynnus TaxID=8237 RepID=UPI003529082F
MTSRVLSAFFFITLVSSITSDPTGLKLRFTSRTLDVLKDLGLEYMQTLVNHRFADFNFQGRIFKATIKGFKFTYLSVNPAQTAVSFQPNSGLQFEIRNMGFSGEFVRSFYMHFLWRDRRLSTKSVTFSGRGVNIKIGVNLKRNPQGHLNVQISTCEVKADHIITRHHSILGRLWDLLKPLYRWLFNRKFCPAVQEYAVPKINAMLESITMTKKLHESYNLDYHLSSNITVTPSCLNVPFRGVFFRQGETVDLSSIKSCMDPVFSESYRMAYVGFSEFFFNSIAMSLQKTGPFKLTIPKFLPLPACSPCLLASCLTCTAHPSAWLPAPFPLPSLTPSPSPRFPATSPDLGSNLPATTLQIKSSSNTARCLLPRCPALEFASLALTLSFVKILILIWGPSHSWIAI